MAAVFVRVTNATAAAYWVAIDKSDVRIINGVGKKRVSAGHHILQYYAEGAAGQGLTITVDGANPPASQTDKVPEGYRHCGGKLEFEV